MKGAHKLVGWEQALVRHVVPAKRNDIGALSDLVRAPFPSGSSTTYESGWQDPAVLGRPQRRPWIIAARFAKESWVPLFSNAASAAELYQANAKSRRLEALLIGCQPEGIGWFFRLHRAAKPVVEFTYSLAHNSSLELRSAEVAPSLFEGCKTGEQAFKRLCSEYEISLPLPQIRVAENGFQAISRRGKPVKTALRGFHIAYGSAS